MEKRDAAVQDALDYWEDLTSNDRVEGDSIDFTQLTPAIVEARNAQNYLNSLEDVRKRLLASEQEAKLLRDRVVDLEERIENARARETAHAGMCDAYVKSLIAVAQGFATGK